MCVYLFISAKLGHFVHKMSHVQCSKAILGDDKSIYDVQGPTFPVHTR